MLNRVISRAHNVWARTMDLLRGRLCRHDDLTAGMKALDEQWNIEIDRRFQQLREEQNSQVEGLFNRFDEQAKHFGEQVKHVDEQVKLSESRLDFLHDLLRQHVLLVSPSDDVFEHSLRHELIEALLSEYIDNFDPYSEATIEAIQQEIKSALAYYRQNFDKRVDLLIAQLPIAELKQLDSQLSDNESRLLLVKLIAYRLLGITKVRLRSAADIELDRNFYSTLQDMISVESPPYRSGSFEVPCYDLNNIGLNFRCYTIPFAINTEFRNRQYANTLIHVRNGDWVLDCGACWGDTSLWFADQAGPTGRVFSFEFIPSSLDIFCANLAMNPELSKCIELVTNPVAESSGDLIRCQDNGAASTFKIDHTEDPNATYVETRTISIDDWVKRRKPEKVDFIKMDIEGAELDALRGSIQTLKSFRPRLAIALYHRPEDLYQIPDFLASLNLGYNFYLKHPTAAGFETVLLAHCALD